MVYKGGKANRSPSCVFVGNLPEKVDDRDIHDLFDKYGEIKDVDIKHGKTSNYTSYAFIEFASVRSAEDAVESRDGYEFDRYRLRVEFAGEKKSRRDRDYDDRGRDRDRGHRYPPPTRTEYRLVISNLPHGCRWQHLKDHMRKAGPVGYVNIVHGRGYVDFMHRSDMKYAVRKLDGSELTTPEDSARIRVRRDERRSRSRDSYRRRSRSVERSRSRSADRRSRTRSAQDKSRSVEKRSRSVDERSRSVDRKSRSRSVDERRSRSVDRRSRSVDRDRSRSVQKSPVNKRSMSYSNRSASVDRKSKSKSRSRSRTYSDRSAHSNEGLKLTADLEDLKPRYDRDAETETAAETYRESPLQA